MCTGREANIVPIMAKLGLVSAGAAALIDNHGYRPTRYSPHHPAPQSYPAKLQAAGLLKADRVSHGS
jgi:hypothetical protein